MRERSTDANSSRSCGSHARLAGRCAPQAAGVASPFAAAGGGGAPGGGAFGGGSGGTVAQVVSWAEAHGKAVTIAGVSGFTVYDLQGAAAS